MPTPFDKPLRDRVKLLGQLLGQTLRDREGRPALDAVETLRQGFIELRGRSEPAPDLRDRLLRLIAALNPETLN
ncbi:MAG: phosphoenolpyruvate carboxylase, partial [Candidatus Competibacteraceae bacterium]